jgi:hypothetical protein
MKYIKGIFELNSTDITPDVWVTDAGLGYNEWAYLIRLDKVENGYSYLVIDSNVEDYQIGSVVDLEDFYVEKLTMYDLKKSPLWNTFLFQHFLKSYHK